MYRSSTEGNTVNIVRTALWGSAAMGAAVTLMTLGVVTSPFVLAYGRVRRVADDPPLPLAFFMQTPAARARVAGIEPALFAALSRTRDE